MRPAPIILAAALVALLPLAVQGQAAGGHGGAPAAHPAPAPAPAAHPAPPPAVHAAPPPAAAPPSAVPAAPAVPVPYAAAPVTTVPQAVDLTLHGITTHPAPPPGPRTPQPWLGVYPAPPPSRPGQPGQGHPAPPPSPTHTPIPPPVVVPVAPYWWGWGWGWGYYPIYPAPPPDVSDLRPGGQALSEGPRTSASLRATVATDTRGGVAGLALSMDGRSLGFQASIDAIDRSRAPATDPASNLGTLGYGTMHATWSFLSERNVRVRLEAGASIVTLGDATGVGAPPYAGSTLFGPSFGVSGHLGLLGPVGLEGHTRLTPSPVPVTDSRVALAIRGGPLAIGLGYRWLGIQGDGTSAPDVRFAGPELQIAARF